MNASIERKSVSQPEMTPDKIPNVIMNENFMQELKSTTITYSDDPQDRLLRGHGKLISYSLFTT